MTDVTMRSVDHHDDLRRPRQAVEALEEEFREVVALYYSADVTYAELAQFLNVSPATANSQLTGHSHGRLPQDWNAPWAECEATYAAWKQWWQSNHHRYPRPVTATPVMKKA